MSPVHRGFRKSCSAPPPPALSSRARHLAGAHEAGSEAPGRVLVPRRPPPHSNWAYGSLRPSSSSGPHRPASGSSARRRGRCRRGRAGPERGGARRGGSAGAAGADRGGLGAWRAALRGAGRGGGGGGRASSERASGEAVAAVAAGGAPGRSSRSAPRAPLLHGAARAARAGPRRAPQGAQPAGDGGALSGLGDHPGLHQPPPAAASQGEGRAAGPAGGRGAVPPLCRARPPRPRRRRREGGSRSGGVPQAALGTRGHSFPVSAARVSLSPEAVLRSRGGQLARREQRGDSGPTARLAGGQGSRGRPGVPEVTAGPACTCGFCPAVCGLPERGCGVCVRVLPRARRWRLPAEVAGETGPGGRRQQGVSAGACVGCVRGSEPHASGPCVCARVCPRLTEGRGPVLSEGDAARDGPAAPRRGRG